MLKRSLESTLRLVNTTFPVLLLTGPRQVGKTTLLKAMAADRHYVTLDDPDARRLAQTDPALFLQRFPAPVLIDEVQYAPGLLTEIKILVDADQQNGLFWLTGSQKFLLRDNIQESLAGRVAILDMNGLSLAEINGQTALSSPFLPTEQWLQTARKKEKPVQDSNALYHHIWRGSYPRVVTQPDIPVDIFYSSYLQTYIQRDVRDLIEVRNEKAFVDFVRVVAARTGQLVNYADMARDTGIDQTTAKAWLAVLEASGLVYLLQPYHNNLTKRLVKTPKLYFLDTGLCAYLTRWSSAEALQAGALAGAILETWVMAELLKSYWYHGKTPNFYFYRDKDQKEIDLLIEQDNVLYPIEIKKTASPNPADARHFGVLEKLGIPVGHGALICLKQADIPLTREVAVIPAYYL